MYLGKVVQRVLLASDMTGISSCYLPILPVGRYIHTYLRTERL